MSFMGFEKVNPKNFNKLLKADKNVAFIPGGFEVNKKNIFSPHILTLVHICLKGSNIDS